MQYQATQLTYILEVRLKELVKDAVWEKALKDVATATAKEKVKAVKATEEKARSLEQARLAAERKLTKAEDKLGEVELKLAKAASLNLAEADAMADLKATLEACENKWFDEGFANTKNSMEPAIHEARVHGFREG